MRARAKRIDTGVEIEGFYFRFNDTHQMALPQVQEFVEIDPTTLVFPEMEEFKNVLKVKTNANQLLQDQVKYLLKQNSELLDGLRGLIKGFRNVSFSESYLSNTQVIDLEAAVWDIEELIKQTEGGEK